MAISPVPQKMSQLAMFARPRCNPHWTDLSPEVQRKIIRLMAQLLRRHRQTRMVKILMRRDTVIGERRPAARDGDVKARAHCRARRSITL
jgi:hypothetical protein